MSCSNLFFRCHIIVWKRLVNFSLPPLLIPRAFALVFTKNCMHHFRHDTQIASFIAPKTTVDQFTSHGQLLSMVKYFSTDGDHTAGKTAQVLSSRFGPEL